MLLSGLTGTGKTLTVEAGRSAQLPYAWPQTNSDPAGSCRQPSETALQITTRSSRLVSCRHWQKPSGRIRISPALESHTAARWWVFICWPFTTRSLTIISEADSLLSKRTLEGGVRNEVVSVMLRQLEYYSGILFMTTNLFDNIDHAVRSRVRLHIEYRALSATHRMTLWKTFLRQSPIVSEKSSEEHGAELSVVLSEENWKGLASWKLNGREIENVVKNVRMWCATKAYTVTLSRLEKLIPLTAPFAKREVDDSFSMLQDQTRKRARIASDGQ